MKLKRLTVPVEWHYALTAALFTLSLTSFPPIAKARLTPNTTTLEGSTIKRVAQANGSDLEIPPQGQSVPLPCQNLGGTQGTAKTPLIINRSDAVIPAGTTIFWQASDQDSGQISLTKRCQDYGTEIMGPPLASNLSASKF